MATTYDLSKVSSPAASALKVGDIINCPYTSNDYKTITLSKGTYKLECWGAQGGKYTVEGGKGGYSVGNLTLTANTTLYLYAGQSPGNGTTENSETGGWNGGATTSDYGGGGGGASDIRIGSTNYSCRVIVAGGGGGAGYNSTTGGYGGGTSGGQGGAGSYAGGYGGTQTAGGNNNTQGAFGYANTNTDAGGGGGGGWYGGASGKSGGTDSGGGGGSGFVYTAAHSANSLNSSYYLTSANTYGGNTSFVDYSGSTVTGHSGNGAVRITVLDVPVPNVAYIKINSTTWKKIQNIYLKTDSNIWSIMEV